MGKCVFCGLFTFVQETQWGRVLVAVCAVGRVSGWPGWDDENP
ncbi:hypothetical protein HMPREF9154_3116 [Arachnia propionica F0230a]|nr:hypothetical protein HMPREF9154_3116 [Arachnia propionica F0230a]